MPLINRKANGTCSRMSATPMIAATMKPRTRITRNSVVWHAPSDCAVKAVVLMRTKANSQNRQSKMTDAIATPPSMAGSPSRPIAVVETMPINGVVRFAIIAGPAMANTCRVVTLVGDAGNAVKLASARRAEQPRQQPDRDHDHGAEQEIAPHPVDRVEAEIPQPVEEALDAQDDVVGIEADRGEHDADQDRQQDQPQRHGGGRAAEKATEAVMGCR